MKFMRRVSIAKAMMDKAKQMTMRTNPTKKVPAAPLPQAENKNTNQGVNLFTVFNDQIAIPQFNS